MSEGVELAERSEPPGSGNTGGLAPFRYMSIDHFNVAY